jgi:hypothetical protein
MLPPPELDAVLVPPDALLLPLLLLSVPVPSSVPSPRQLDVARTRRTPGSVGRRGRAM